MLFLTLFNFQKGITQQDSSFWPKVRFGGNVGIGFSNESFNAILAPAAIYDFNEQFSAGVGIHFGYSDFRNFEAFNYGASLIGLYNPIPVIQLSAEFEEMGVSRTIKIIGQEDISDTYWYPALFLGAGYRFGAVSLGLRYDVLYDNEKSIYASAYAPFFRVFF